MPAARYAVLHVNAKTGAVISTLPVIQLSYTDALNAAGAASLSIPLDCPQATPEVLFPGGSSIVVLRDGEPVWGGILWTLEADLEAGTLALNATGYHSHYQGKHFTTGYKAIQKDQGWILREWFERTNSDSNNGIGTDASYISTSGRLRTREWSAVECKNVAEAIEELADDAGGFNFRYDPYWEVPGVRIGNRFLKSGRGGSRIPSALVHRGNCNVTRVSYDSTSLATNVYVFGADNGADTKPRATARNDALWERIPAKDIVETYSDAKSVDVLKSKASALIAIGRAPIAIPTLTLYPGLFDPREFTTGDTASVRVDSGYVALYGDFVVTERKVDVNANGTELITLALADRELFLSGDSN